VSRVVAGDGPDDGAVPVVLRVVRRIDVGVHRVGGAGLTLNVYTAAPGSPTADGLAMLASWAATQDLAEAQQVPPA
jgi:hypothetical protein